VSQFRVSDAARSDVDEIWFYIAQDNPDAADKFIHALISKFPVLASMPDWDAGAKSCRRDRGVCQSVATSYLSPDGERR
jgi:plasmid stabilization system protein ParE